MRHFDWPYESGVEGPYRLTPQLVGIAPGEITAQSWYRSGELGGNGNLKDRSDRNQIMENKDQYAFLFRKPRSKVNKII
jgi:hypothetical protein